jgi:serine/threonine-protein kinase RsbW
VVNAIKFGNREVVDDFLKPVFVSIRLDEGHITLMVEDFGQGFDIDSLPDPTLRSHLMRSDGRGLFLIRELMDRVEFNDQGNVITMVREF